MALSLDCCHPCLALQTTLSSQQLSGINPLTSEEGLWHFRILCDVESIFSLRLIINFISLSYQIYIYNQVELENQDLSFLPQDWKLYWPPHPMFIQGITGFPESAGWCRHVRQDVFRSISFPFQVRVLPLILVNHTVQLVSTQWKFEELCLVQRGETGSHCTVSHLIYLSFLSKPILYVIYKCVYSIG